MNKIMINSNAIASGIYLIRGKKVMLDQDLASLYGVSTKHLKRQVRRNLDRFPADFMFELTGDETENLRRHFGTSSFSHGGTRYLPYAFTEHGILMLSSVLNSPRAVQVNIAIMRVFLRLREMVLTNREFALRLERIERAMDHHDGKIRKLFQKVTRLSAVKRRPPRLIGFRS